MKSLIGRGIANIGPSKDEGTMLPLAVIYLVAVICSARWTHALPLYPDTNMETDTSMYLFLFPLHFLKQRGHSSKMNLKNVFVSTDLIQKFVSEVEERPDNAEGEQSQVNNLYPLLMQQNMGRDSWTKGTRNYQQSDICRYACSELVLRLYFEGSKDSAQQDNFGIMVRRV